MIIKSSQLQAFSNAQAGRFIQETLRRLRESNPHWGEGKSEGELCVQLEDIVKYATGARIKKRSAVNTVVDAFVRFNPAIPVDPRLTEVLQRPNIPENIRAEQFYLALASGRYQLKEVTALD